MTIFQGPDASKPTYVSKFLRFGEQIHVSRPGDTEIFHSELAERDNIVFDFIEVQMENIHDVDGGLLHVQNSEEGSQLLFYGDTRFFPYQTSEARVRTGEVASRISPESRIMTTGDLRPKGIER